MFGAEIPGGFQKTWLRRNDTHVADDRFENDGGNVRTTFVKRLFQDGDVVEFDRQRVGRAACGNSRAGGDAQCQRATAGLHQQAVDMSVIAAGELHDHIASGMPACEADRRHGRFGPRVHHPHLLDRGHDFDDEFGQFRFQDRGCSKTRAVRQRAFDRADHRRMSMPEDMRTPRSDVIDQPIAIDVVQVGPFAAFDDERLSAHATKRPRRAIHATGNRPRCPFKMRTTFLS